MKAAVFHGIKDIRTEEVEKPEIQENEILINVKACGICGSDLHLYKLNLFGWMVTRPLKKGGIPGHEFSGDIVKVGSKVKGFREGDKVVAFHNGGMAEYVPVPVYEGFNVIKIPSNVTYEEAATLEPLSNSYHALMNGEPFKGANILIFGVGTIGLGIIQCIRALKMDINKIIAIDLSDYRLSFAKNLGADEIINARARNLQKKITDIVGTTQSMRVSILTMPNIDIIYDCVGSVKNQKGPIVLQQAIGLVREGTGKIVVHGIYEDNVNMSLLFMVGKEVTIKGSFAFSRLEVEKSMELIENKKIDRSKLITHEFSLDKAKEAFETQCNTDESVKVLIKP
ncbi:MAG: zinc-dependent alcohol dehydrogenase [Candidatus Hodarchaeales archaeon]|jgi:2-desacetyl-2-hydroxyethyl bacteriochlorophyllide A dehydrogenase